MSRAFLQRNDSTDHPSATDPYFLYAASNIGSFLALLSYPIVIEPMISLTTQTWLWATLLWRRTSGGWELADLVDAGHTYEQAAEQLGVTPSAVSQRAQAAAIVEARRARELVTELTRQLLTPEAA